MIKIAVCDDEIQLLKQRLNSLLKKALAQLKVQAEIIYYSDGLVLLDDFKKKNAYDVVILDIDMPSINGKELAGNLRAVDSEFTLAFLTAYEKEVFSAIPISISAFIPKNFDDERILSALIDLFNAYLAKKPQYEVFSVLIGGKPSTVKIQAGNIYYFQYAKRIITLNTYNESFILAERVFDSIIKKYLSRGFYQINRTCVVNVTKVYEVLDGNLIMDNGDKLAVSRRAKKGLLREVTLLPIIREAR